MAPSLIPHSFVLADLFDVSSMCLEVPDHVLENDPGLEWTSCLQCNGERWVESGISTWATPYALTFFPNVCTTLKPCLRCYGEGEVLDVYDPTPLEFTPLQELALAA